MEKSDGVRTWAIVLHLSVFAGYIVPIAGLAAPILIWQLKKQELPELDEHGKIVVNWLISSIIYTVVGFVLTFVVIGFLFLLALIAVGIIFPIIGAVKASQGVAWTYPLSIRFV